MLFFARFLIGKLMQTVHVRIRVPCTSGKIDSYCPYPCPKAW